MPERDIESLGVMGWGLDAAGNSSVVAAVAVALPILYVCNTKTATLCFQKKHDVSLWEKNALAAALPPSTVLL